MENERGDAERVGSIFAGSVAIINSFLTLAQGESITQKSTCRKIVSKPIQAGRFHALASDLYGDFARRRRERRPSGENWRWTQQTSLNENNRSPKVLLERAIAILAVHGHLHGWSNQMPVASGLVDEHQDKRAAIDLARLENGTLDLIELKWSSVTPLFAALEIFLYGIAYLFCRAHRSGFGYTNLKTMQAHHVSLSVLAPKQYYETLDLRWLQLGLATGFQELARATLGEPITTAFRFLALPERFELPFENGSQVIEACSATEPDERAQLLLQAIGRVAPLYPA